MQAINILFWGSWDARRLWTSRFAPERPALWLLYRALVFLYSLSVSIVDRAISAEPSHRYIAYLTVQGVWLTVCYFTCALLVTACVAAWPSLRDALEPACATPQPHVALSRPARLAWVGLGRATQLLWCVALPFEVVIVTLYWLLLATPKNSALAAWDNAESHGVKLLLLLLELALSSMTLPDAHSFVLAAALTGYLITNCWVTLTEYPVCACQGVLGPPPSLRAAPPRPHPPSPSPGMRAPPSPPAQMAS